MTTPRFELTSQRHKVSRLPTEPPGRPVLNPISFLAPPPNPTKKVLVLIIVYFIYGQAERIIVQMENSIRQYDYLISV